MRKGEKELGMKDSRLWYFCKILYTCFSGKIFYKFFIQGFRFFFFFFPNNLNLLTISLVYRRILGVLVCFSYGYLTWFFFVVFVSEEDLWVWRLRFTLLEIGLVVGFMGLFVLLEIWVWFFVGDWFCRRFVFLWLLILFSFEDCCVFCMFGC